MGSFNFEKAIAEDTQQSQVNSLRAIILGQSGSGKSSLLGTFGVKTLYLYGSGEDHGPSAARSLGGDVVAVPWDKADGASLTPDAAFKRILSVLDDVEGIKKAGFGAICLDSATELEILVKSTSAWKALCLTPKGGHNNFAETGATSQLIRQVIDALKAVRKALNVHIAVTCILDVKAMDSTGAIEEASPRLTGYHVAEGLIQQFGDVLVIGKLLKDEVSSHRLQFDSGVSKQSKDQAGQVKKMINFNPRIEGLSADKLPASFPADLKKLAEFKAKGGKK